MTETAPELQANPPFHRKGHIQHCKRFLFALPASCTDYDSSRMSVVFYCLGSLDLLGAIGESTSEAECEKWREWIWAQQTKSQCGTAFTPGPFMKTGELPSSSPVETSGYGAPHIIMTYTALLSLAILRDDFSKLDRPGLLKFVRSCQRKDGSVSTLPSCGEFDLRALYCAFAISSMLDDWSGVNVELSLSFIASCRTYEGGYGQYPDCEAHGGTTYIAIASIYLAPGDLTGRLTPEERHQTIQWLVRNQAPCGGFAGRTGKDADACYCFWCGAALKILGASSYVDETSLVRFLARCQFKFGGISKAPDERPDPYHTYLSLAALSMYTSQKDSDQDPTPESWAIGELDPKLNASSETARWARDHISIKRGNV